MAFPFEVHYAELQGNLDTYVDAVFDGTARDKVTRVQHLAALSIVGQPADQPKFEVIACIAGRGFGVRLEDMKKLTVRQDGFRFALPILRPCRI